MLHINNLFELCLQSVVFCLMCDRLFAVRQCYIGVTHKSSENHTELEGAECSNQTQGQHKTSGQLTSCFIFYDTIADSAEFGCDDENVCNSGQPLQNSMCYKQVRGSLYCCSGDLCNAASRLYHMNPPQAHITCYSGTNDGRLHIDEIRCPYSCYSETLRLRGGQLLNETFGCDNRCDSSFSSTDRCRQTTSPDGVLRRSCTCSKDRCNHNVHLMPPDVFDSSVTTSRPLIVSMNNPLWDRKHSSTSDGSHWLVPFIVILVGLGLLVLSAIAVVRIYRYRKRVCSVAYVELSAERA